MDRSIGTPLFAAFSYAIATAALTFFLALPLGAQQPATITFGTAANARNPAGTVETSTIVAAVEGPHMNLWLIARRTGLILTRDANGDLTRPSAGTRTLPANSYLILLDVTDSTILKKFDVARATVIVVSPSERSTSIDFNPVKGSFGCPLTLSEKGEYRFTINVHAGKHTRMAQFRYAAK